MRGGLQHLGHIAHCLDRIIDDRFHCGLPRLKRELAKIDYKLNYILDRKTKYGLYSLKHEIINCSQYIKNNLPRLEKFNNVLTHSALTYKDIKKNVDKIAETVTNPVYGMKEILHQVRQTEHNLGKLLDKVARIYSNQGLISER